MPFLITPRAPTTTGITTVLICHMRAISISRSLYLDSFSDTLRTVPTNSKVFLRGFLNVREKQILTSGIEIQKENWG